MSLFNKNYITFHALQSLEKLIGMFTLGKLFVVEKCLLPCIMRILIVWVLLETLFLATFVSLIHGNHRFKHLELKTQSKITIFITHPFMRRV